MQIYKKMAAAIIVCWSQLGYSLPVYEFEYDLPFVNGGEVVFNPTSTLEITYTNFYHTEARLTDDGLEIAYRFASVRPFFTVAEEARIKFIGNLNENILTVNSLAFEHHRGSFISGGLNLDFSQSFADMLIAKTFGTSEYLNGTGPIFEFNLVPFASTSFIFPVLPLFDDYFLFADEFELVRTPTASVNEPSSYALILFGFCLLWSASGIRAQDGRSVKRHQIQ